VTTAELVERTGTTRSPGQGRDRLTRLLLASLPWSVPAVAAVAGLLWTGVSGADIALYAGYAVGYVALPGTLVHRLLRGSRGNLPEDVGYGAATGLLLQLAVWAAAAATGQQHLLRWWILPVVLAFLVVPGWRRHWRVTDPRPLPLRWSWMVAAGLLAVVGVQVAAWVTNPLPPSAGVYYQDMMYHLALVHEMTRSMPFEVPQLAGDGLRYHYLSDADMATAAMISGIDPATVLFRLWLVPIGAVAVLAFAALTREITGIWWTGPLGGAAAVAGYPLVLGVQVSGAAGPPLYFHSPSQSYALPLMVLFAALAVDALRGRPLHGGWFLVPALALACAGAKSSALPPLAGGLLVAGVVAAITRRRVPWSVLGLLVAAAAGMVAGTRLFAGGGAGVLSLQPLSLLRAMPPYARTVGANDGVDDGGTFLPPGIASADQRASMFVAGVVLWWLVMQSPRLLGLLGIGSRRITADPVAWFLGGTLLAGLGAAWVFFHPAASQGYFYLCAAPFGAILTVWFAAERARRWRTFAAGLLAGAGWVILDPAVPVPEGNTVGAWWPALLTPILWALIAAGVVLSAAVVVVSVRRRSFPVRTLARAGLAGLAAAVVGAGLATSVTMQAEPIRHAASGARPAPDPVRQLSEDELTAALWLAENSGRDDVVATNVHCTPVSRVSPCDARAFWVSGLGGRRTVLESWGYSDATTAANGRDNLRFPFQPPPYPSLREQNDRIFTDAAAADLADLRRRYGVRWLFADSRAGTVSQRLADIATPRIRFGPVTVYEVR
jgi:hypothetical protein